MATALALVLACKSEPVDTAADPDAEVEEPIEAADPEPAPARLDVGAPAEPVTPPVVTALESGPASEEIVAAARAIQKDLECLRGKKFEQDPGVRFQSLADFKAYVDKQLDKELGGEKGAAQQRLLHATGLLPRDVSLRDILSKATVEQAAAYYDPETNEFYVVQEMPDFLLKGVMAHELQHALQDQHTKLLDAYLTGGFGTLDADLAARFVVEGEATLVGNAWLVNSMSSGLFGDGAGVCHLPGRTKDGQAPDLFWPTIRPVVEGPAAQTRHEIQNPGLAAKLATAAMSPAMAESLSKLETLPNFVFYSLLLPYNKGGLTVFEMLEDGGFAWKPIDKAFARPPESTEQVLHPDRLGAPFEDPKLDDPEVEGFADWKKDPDDRVGELGIFIWLVEQGVPERQAAALADGWDGDRIRVYSRDLGEGKVDLAFDWVIVWDDADEASAFRSRLIDALRDFHGALEGGLPGGDIGESFEGAMSYRYMLDGSERHGRVAWKGDRLRITDGWTAAPFITLGG
jgi:hypothetical protein